jgi:hypothetical protein
MTVKLIPAYAKKLHLATQESQRMRTIYNTLKHDGTYDARLNAMTIPATCQYALHDDLLYLIDPKDKRLRLVLSSRELRKQQLATAHDETHCGFCRTFKRLSSFYWPSMAKDIAAYLAHCPACLVNKPARHKPYGKLSPISSPSEPFDTITIDLITDLPPCARDGAADLFDTIMTITDKFSKAVRFIPGRKDWSAVSWSTQFYEDVVLNGWGFPRTIISDRDKRFLSGLWQALLSAAGVKSLTTTAYHPSADGQSERTNQTLEVMLRYLVNANQSNWLAKLLPLQAACNNHTIPRHPKRIVKFAKPFESHTRNLAESNLTDITMSGCHTLKYHGVDIQIWTEHSVTEARHTVLGRHTETGQPTSSGCSGRVDRLCSTGRIPGQVPAEAGKVQMLPWRKTTLGGHHTNELSEGN